MTNRKMKWRQLKALHQIYTVGFTKNKISNHPYIDYLIRHEIIRPKIGKPSIIERGIGYEEYYKEHHLNNYGYYQEFLSNNSILTDQSNFNERDIQTLIFIQSQKDRILQDQYSRRKFSTVFFKDEGSKHLDKNPGLEKAVLSILGLDQFPGKDPKDQQYRFVVDCPNPKCIVLCENIDFLLMPWVSRELNIELWYAGGNNIEKLNHLPEIKLPIYYSCDWDYDGMLIYERIKKKIPEIKLLFPSAIEDRKPVNSENHFSVWKNEPLSGLNNSMYTDPAKDLLNELINSGTWIEEENNDLETMFKFIMK